MDGASLPAWLLCLAWASSGPAAWDGIDATAPPRPAEAVLPLPHSLRLEWTHSIERVRWQEWYTPSLPPDPVGWRLLRVRVHGSGAGMEPAPDAVWRAGGYEWTPMAPVTEALRLMASAYAADYRLCLDERCQPLRSWWRSAPPVTARARGRVGTTPAPSADPDGTQPIPGAVVGPAPNDKQGDGAPDAAAVRLRPCPSVPATPPAAGRSG